jgi:cellulose synthase/poly-beta-1,6-N-acetylglucosamine synthase-like glycosyltransferase
MTFIVLVLWAVTAFFSLGVPGINYILTRRAAGRSWNTKKDDAYLPSVSAIVPTYNECEVIEHKLANLAKLEYPEGLLQLVFVDSCSTDSTVDTIRDFIARNPRENTQLLIENERRGKSSALNTALQRCVGDIIVVSDADCFWPSKILLNSLPYLADPVVGAISGPKTLLNSKDTWVTRSEDRYLKTANLIKSGESKISSTLLFEGGFSAYKRGAFESFDPYHTGSDDCGTVISCLEKNLRTIMVTEGEFFTTFPKDWNGRIEIKIRRSAQLVRVLQNYGRLLLKGAFRNERRTVLKNLLIYGLAPIVFPFLIAITVYLMVLFPPMTAILVLFLIPKVNSYLTEVVLNYMIMLYSMISTLSNRTFSIWKKPRDRAVLTKEMLFERDLI